MLHTHEATGSSPVVSTKITSGELRGSDSQERVRACVSNSGVWPLKNCLGRYTVPGNFYVSGYPPKRGPCRTQKRPNGGKIHSVELFPQKMQQFQPHLWKFISPPVRINLTGRRFAASLTPHSGLRPLATYSAALSPLPLFGTEPRWERVPIGPYGPGSVCEGSSAKEKCAHAERPKYHKGGEHMTLFAPLTPDRKPP